MTSRIVFIAAPVIAAGAISLTVFGMAYVLLGMIDDPLLADSISQEDGPIETLGAASLALAAGLHFVLFWRSDVPIHRRLLAFLRRNPFYLALAAALFVAFAEEISWGQRIFGWATPEALLEVNTQNETNIHNLAPFQGGPLSLTRMWNLFWLSYCVLVPLSNAASPRLRSMYRRISLPVPPLWVAGMFLGCYAAFRASIMLLGDAGMYRADEAKEAFLAMCWVVLGVVQLRADTRGDRGQASAATTIAQAPDPVPSDGRRA